MVETTGRIHQPDGGEEVYQLLLPGCLKGEVLKQLHDEHGHQGIERTSELVRQVLLARDEGRH